jgi:KDO2-lipid IV(A) lauroyltransferase
MARRSKSKKPRPAAVDYLVYLVVRFIVAVAQAMTIEQSYALADALAALAYRVDRRHRLVADENLKAAFGDGLDADGRDRVIRGVYSHFFRMIMEMLHIPRKMHLETWRRRIRLVGHEPVLDRLLSRDDAGPMIMLSGHFGNWELAGYLFGVFGFPPHSVARPLDNAYLDAFLRRFRERTGQKMIAKKGGYDDMLEVLRSGGVLSMLADQDAGERGLFVDFFGRPASTHKAIGLLAVEYNACVVVGTAHRVGPGFDYEVRCHDLIPPESWADHPDPVRFVTERYTRALEDAVRLAPEQYLWLHRRWKHQPKPRRSKVPAPHRAAASLTASDVAAA